MLNLKKKIKEDSGLGKDRLYNPGVFIVKTFIALPIWLLHSRYQYVRSVMQARIYCTAALSVLLSIWWGKGDGC